tara:strand:- start:76 stop:876 length:801 start_codon:yes stop_codon:yes gene_type:complete
LTKILENFNNKNTPLVSVIINCYNGQKYLEQCIKSILNQNYKNWELIFYDNCSTDSSKDIFKKYSDNNNFFYVKSKKLINLYSARNKALEFTNGKYICYIDVDDLWSEEKLEEQVKFLNNNKEFGIVYSNFTINDEIKKIKKARYTNPLPSGNIYKDLIKNYQVGMLTVCFRKEILKQFLFNNEYNIIGDFDLIIRISKSIKIGCIDKELAIYRLHENNFHKKLKVYINELENWLQENKQDLKNIEYFNMRYSLLKLKIKNLIGLS